MITELGHMALILAFGVALVQSGVPLLGAARGHPGWMAVGRNTALAQFGLVYTVPQYYRDYYRSILVNIPFVNGDESWRLPLPATYVIGRDGRVAFAEAHADFRVRPEPEEAFAVACGVR